MSEPGPNEPLFTITDSETGLMVVAIHRDGRVERGPGFTTTEAASQEFWLQLQRIGITLLGEQMPIGPFEQRGDKE